MNLSLLALLSLQTTSGLTVNALVPLSSPFIVQSHKVYNPTRSISISSPLYKPLKTSTLLYQSEKAEESTSNSSSSTGGTNTNSKSITDLVSMFQSETEDLGQINKGKSSSTTTTTTSISDIASAITDNLKDGELGSRGEVYFVLQLVLVFCILFGTVPIIGDAISFIFGPGLILLGGSVAAIGAVELGTNLTPWPSPPKDGSLVTDGLVFSELRHPIYAGLLFLMFGLSMWSGSAMRVLLSAALWALLDFKSDLEEKELVEKFGTDYVIYREKVQGKFIPQRLTDAIENLSFALSLGDDLDLDMDMDEEFDNKFQ